MTDDTVAAPGPEAVSTPPVKYWICPGCGTHCTADGEPVKTTHAVREGYRDCSVCKRERWRYEDERDDARHSY